MADLYGAEEVKLKAAPWWIPILPSRRKTHRNKTGYARPATPTWAPMAYDRMYTASMSLLDATTAMIPKSSAWARHFFQKWKAQWSRAYGARRISRPRQTIPKAHSIIAVPSTQPRAMNKPHTNHTSKAFADITGIIDELPRKNAPTSRLLTRKPPICASR